MISVILLIFTIILIAIGGICGFRRGALKEGVRIVLWIVLFACSLFFIPQVADKLPLFIAERLKLTAADVEQVVSVLLNKVDILKRETYLILPLAGFVRTLLVPFITIVFFWAAGFVSWIIYLIVALFLHKKTEQQGAGSKITGLVFGIIVALFSGSITIYPVAALSSAVQEGDDSYVLCEEFPVIKTVAKAYEGSVVKMVYQLTGTEFLGTVFYDAVNATVIAEDTHNIWKELPKLIGLGSEGWQTYAQLTGKATGQTSLKECAGRAVENYFALDFITEENKLLLLKRLKSTAGSFIKDSKTTMLLNWIEIQNKEQFKNDMAVYAGVYDALKQEGILNAVLNGAGMPELSEEAGTAIVTALYELSNAQTVVPEFINLIYATVMSGAEKNLVQTETLDWNEETKAEINEVVSAICKVSAVMGHADSMSTEEKKTVLDAIKGLKDNKAVGKENYAALLKLIMGML